MSTRDEALAFYAEHYNHPGWRVAELHLTVFVPTGEQMDPLQLVKEILDDAAFDIRVVADEPPLADHPHTDPGDGRSQCETCGKWVWLVTHSCKGVRVAPKRVVMIGGRGFGKQSALVEQVLSQAHERGLEVSLAPALDPAVVLAAIDEILAVDPRSPARLSIMKTRLKRLRAKVAEYIG